MDQQAELTAADGSGGTFGASVAISGTTIAVAAPGNYDRGAVYVFSDEDGVWVQQATIPKPKNGDGFAASVAMSGTTMVVGAPDAELQVGAAYVYSETGGIWTRQTELMAYPAVSGDDFGASVAISGTTAIVGAPYSSLGRGVAFGVGAAFVFSNSSGAWERQGVLTAPPDGSGNDRLFGGSVAISDAGAVVGAQQGAYVFKPNGQSWGPPERASGPASPQEPWSTACATDALQADADIVELLALLGHASLDTTRRYLDATAEGLRDVIKGHLSQINLRQHLRQP